MTRRRSLLPLTACALFAAGACSSSSGAPATAAPPSDSGASDSESSDASNSGGSSSGSSSGGSRSEAGAIEASASDARASDDAHADGLPYALCLYQDTDLSRVEQNLGRPIDALQDYNSRTDWTSWAAIGSWPLNSVSKPIPLSVGLILDTGADLATAASGGYDSYYQQLAQSLNQYESKVAAVRIGWEMNGSWFSWGIVDTSNNPKPEAAQNYVAAFRRLAGFIRQYAPWCPIDWCVNQGGPDPTVAYPGDDVVDIIGMDLYEQNVGSFSGALGNGSDGLLKWLDAFSQKTSGANAPPGQTGGKKRVSFPEWQATGGDGTFVTQMAAWMNGLGDRMAYQCYWDSDTAVNPGGSLYANPTVDMAYTNAWKGTTFGGTIPLAK